MPADANPGFDVVTVKPSKPGQQGKLFRFRGRSLVTFNTNMNDLVAFAYSLHTKQIIGAPDWFGTDPFDIDGVPDVEGRPSLKQMRSLLQKLLADRFKLTFHHDQKELSAYILTVAPGGPKFKMTTAGPNDPPGFLFRGLGDLMVRNMDMKEFANGMQSAVMDKPVIDQTGLKDKYDFNLKWTPDDSQFAQFRGAGGSAAGSADGGSQRAAVALHGDPGTGRLEDRPGQGGRRCDRDRSRRETIARTEVQRLPGHKRLDQNKRRW